MNKKTKIIILTQAVVYFYIMYTTTANLMFITILSLIYGFIGTAILSVLIEELKAYLYHLFGTASTQVVEPAKKEVAKEVEFIPSYKERLLMLATEAVEVKGMPATRDAVMAYIRSRGVSVPNAHWSWLKKSIKPRQFPSL